MNGPDYGYDPYNPHVTFTSGIDFVGDSFTEVGASKFGRKLGGVLKKVGKGVLKVAKPLINAAAKIVPAPYNIAFKAGANITNAAASAVQKKKAKKAIQGLGALAKAGDRKAAATLATLKLSKDAAGGNPAKLAQTIAQTNAKKKSKAAAAAPARNHGGGGNRAFVVRTPSGKSITVHV